MNRESVVMRIRTDVCLSDVERYESAALRHLIEQAQEHDPQVNRWQMYEELKQQASTLVGWDARHPALRTSRHYEALLHFIDELLPLNDEESVIFAGEPEKQRGNLQKLDLTNWLRELAEKRPGEAS